MNHLKTASLLLAFCVFLFTSCGNQESADKAEATKKEVKTESKKAVNQPKVNTPKPATKAYNPAEEAATMKQYIADNKMNAKKTASGIFYTMEKEGSGANPTVSSTVTVHYRGYLLDGTEFDSSYKRNKPATFPLGRVVKGWQEGIPLFKKGGKGTLVIPSALGYGANPRPGGKIPPNAPLVFDIELVDIE